MNKKQRQQKLIDEFQERIDNLPQSYWDKLGEKIKAQQEEYERIERAQRPSWEDMYKPFDI